MDNLIRLRRTVAPAVEPLTTSQAKQQINWPDDDTTHDDKLELAITAAREQWEHDTDSATTTQTWVQTFAEFSDGMRLAMRPVIAVSGITYYDINNTQQTLSTSVYSLDAGTRQLRLQVDQDWPNTQDRWDCVEVTFTAGYGATGTSVPAVARQAMLLSLAWHFENPDMLAVDNSNDMRAYRNLVAQYQRSSYP